MLFGTMMILLFIVLPLAGAGAVWRLTRNQAGLDFIARLLLALVCPALASSILLASYAIAMGPRLEWNGAKIAPAIAMLKGYALYQDKDTGVMDAWIYGPIPALIYLPSALLMRTGPTAVITAGIIINMLCFLGPALWLHLRVLDRAQRRGQTLIVALLAFFAFFWVATAHEGPRRATYMVSTDGPALGFAVCSCALLMRPRGPRTTLHLSLIALCAVLSCWCKQLMLPFLVVAPVFLYLTERLDILKRYLVLLAGIALVVSTVLLLSFGPRAMWFHMVTIPSSHPWRDGAETFGDKFAALLFAVAGLFGDCDEALVLLLAVILIASAAGLFRGAFARDSWKIWIKENDWIVLAFSAVVLIPASLLGFVKIGGYVNNFALSHGFVALAATVGIAAIWPRITQPGLAWLARAALCVMIVARGAQVVLAEKNISNMLQALRTFNDNPQQVVYRFALKYPETGYFPWHNLPTLLADGKLYHFEWGFIDRVQGKMPPTSEQVRRHIPAKMQFIGFYDTAQSTQAMVSFPEYTQIVTTSELPEFRLATIPNTLAPMPPAQQPAGTRP